MRKRQTHKKSKQITLKQKYKVQKKVRDHHRKWKKEARNAKKNGLPVKQSSKVARIPNWYPGKKTEIKEQSMIKALQQMIKKKDKLVTQKDIDNLIVEAEGIVKTG